jgi:hypothetical protein
LIGVPPGPSAGAIAWAPCDSGFDAHSIDERIDFGADGASRVRKQVRKSLNGWKNGWFNVRNPDKIADWIEIVLWATVSFPLTV